MIIHSVRTHLQEDQVTDIANQNDDSNLDDMDNEATDGQMHEEIQEDDIVNSNHADIIDFVVDDDANIA